MLNKIELKSKFGLFEDRWSPKIIGEINDSYVKVAKFENSFTWHKHDTEDEMFFIVKGVLTIKLRDGDVTLHEGELLIVPKGVEHMPVAEEEVWVMLLEPKTTLNTGDVVNEKTVEKLDWI